MVKKGLLGCGVWGVGGVGWGWCGVGVGGGKKPNNNPSKAVMGMWIEGEICIPVYAMLHITYCIEKAGNYGRSVY